MSTKFHTHIVELAAALSIQIDWRERTRARAWRKSRRVRISPIKTAITYAMALHEMGHIAGRQSGPRIDREVQAWQWAKENALEWRKPMKRTAARCLTLYVRWAERRRGVIKPQPGHPIYKWIN